MHAYVDVPSMDAKTKSRIVDLDVDIGADAVDYKCVAPALLVACDLTLYLCTVLLRTRSRFRALKLRCASLKGLSRK